MGDVAELVAEAAGGADGLVDVAVGVAVDPVVDSAGGDVVGQLDAWGHFASKRAQRGCVMGPSSGCCF